MFDYSSAFDMMSAIIVATRLPVALVFIIVSLYFDETSGTRNLSIIILTDDSLIS